MRKQSSRPNQATRMQMKKDLTAELFATSSNEDPITFRRAALRRSLLAHQPPPPSPPRAPQILIVSRTPPTNHTNDMTAAVPEEHQEEDGGEVGEEDMVELVDIGESDGEVEVEEEEDEEQDEEQEDEEEYEESENGEISPSASEISVYTAIEIPTTTTTILPPTPFGAPPNHVSVAPPPPPRPSISIPTPTGWGSPNTTSPSSSTITTSTMAAPMGNGLVYNRASPFETRKTEKLTNPFANRRRFSMDNTTTTSATTTPSPSFSSRFSSSASARDFLVDDFSSMSVVGASKFAAAAAAAAAASGGNRNSRANGGEVMLPAWWKTRSFSSATCYYPQNIKSQTKSITTMNVPSHGSLDDIDSYLTTTNHHHRRTDLLAKKERWARMKAKKRQLRRPVDETSFDEDADEEEEIMCGRGVMLNPIVQRNGSDHFEDADLLRKYQRDVAYVKEQLSKEVDGNLDRIREIRFLIASVQTYGNIDGQCMMAELAMNEFTLFSGVLERFHSIIGPWSIESEIQKRRASRHAFETHKIPLQHNFATISKRKLVEEILGRSEPSVAYRQGVKVGLYSDTCDEQFRVHLHIKNGFKDNAMMVDANERRFILVLQSELELMVESMKHLANTVSLQYDGFPTTFDRFIIAEAFVEAVAAIIGESVTPEMMRWFTVLGQKVQTDATTPWEKNVELHCARHSDPRNNFCAQVTVCRTSFIILHILGTFFRRYHLRKIPTTSNTLG